MRRVILALALMGAVSAHAHSDQNGRTFQDRTYVFDVKTPANSPARIKQCAAARDAALAPAIQRQTQSCATAGPKCDSARANLVAERARLNAAYDACVKAP